jgi:hypothetical protein
MLRHYNAGGSLGFIQANTGVVSRTLGCGGTRSRPPGGAIGVHSSGADLIIVEKGHSRPCSGFCKDKRVTFIKERSRADLCEGDLNNDLILFGIGLNMELF